MKVKIKYLLAILLGLLFLWDVFLTTANKFITPLESSGLTPLWEENFMGGSLDLQSPYLCCARQLRLGSYHLFTCHPIKLIGRAGLESLVVLY